MIKKNKAKSKRLLKKAKLRVWRGLTMPNWLVYNLPVKYLAFIAVFIFLMRTISKTIFNNLFLYNISRYALLFMIIFVLFGPIFHIIKVLISSKSSKSFLYTIADLLPKKQRQILQHEARDMMEEYEEAILFGKPLRAKIIVSFYYIGIGWSAVMWISDKIKEVIGITPKKN